MGKIMKNLEENRIRNEYEQVNTNSVSQINNQESIGDNNTHSKDLVSLLNSGVDRQERLIVDSKEENRLNSNRNVERLSEYVQNGSDSYKRNTGQEVTFRHVTDFDLEKIRNNKKKESNKVEANPKKEIRNMNIEAIQSNPHEDDCKTLSAEVPPHKESLSDYSLNNQSKLDFKQEFERRGQHNRTNRQKMINMKEKNALQKSHELTPATITSIMRESEKYTNYGTSLRYLKYIDSVIALAVLVNIVLSIIDNDLYITYSETYLSNYTAFYNITYLNITVVESISHRTITFQENLLRYINASVILVILTLIYFHYLFKMRLYKAEDRLSKYDNMFTSGLYKNMLLEMLICAVFYPPYLNIVLIGSTSEVHYIIILNSIISFLVMFKCYIIVRVYSYFSRWTSDLARSICIKEHVNAGILFAVKAELKKRPYLVLTFLLLVSLGMASFAIRTFEFGVIDPTGITTGLKGNNQLQLLANCFWLIIITMTTVGYGDMFPRSNMGRLIGVFACIIGMVLLSMFIVSLAVVTQFTSEEEKAFIKMKKLKAEDNVEQKAVDVIKALILLRKINSTRVNQSKECKKNRTGGKVLKSHFNCLTQLKRSLSIFKNDFKLAASHSVPIDEVLSRLEFELDDNVNKLNAKKFNTIDRVLNNLTNIQDEIRRKYSVITYRQKNISNYLIKLNNTS